MSSPRNSFGLGEAMRQSRERKFREAIDLAIDLARTNEAAWRHLRTLLVAWAREDEVKRRELAGELAALGKGHPGNAVAADWANGRLVGLVKIWTAPGSERMKVEAALLRVASEFPGEYPSELQALKNRYYRVRKDPVVRRIAGLPE